MLNDVVAQLFNVSALVNIYIFLHIVTAVKFFQLELITNYVTKGNKTAILFRLFGNVLTVQNLYFICWYN